MHGAAAAREQCCRVEVVAQLHEVGPMMIVIAWHVRAYVRSSFPTSSAVSCATPRFQRAQASSSSSRNSKPNIVDRGHFFVDGLLEKICLDLDCMISLNFKPTCTSQLSSTEKPPHAGLLHPRTRMLQSDFYTRITTTYIRSCGGSHGIVHSALTTHGSTPTYSVHRPSRTHTLISHPSLSFSSFNIIQYRHVLVDNSRVQYAAALSARESVRTPKNSQVLAMWGCGEQRALSHDR